jgi:hypothetical protein
MPAQPLHIHGIKRLKVTHHSLALHLPFQRAQNRLSSPKPAPTAPTSPILLYVTVEASIQMILLLPLLHAENKR